MDRERFFVSVVTAAAVGWVGTAFDTGEWSQTGLVSLGVIVVAFAAAFIGETVKEMVK